MEKTAREQQNETSKQNRDFLKARYVDPEDNTSYFSGMSTGKGAGDIPVFIANGSPISPPGSMSTDHLKEKCIGCQLCISTYPTKVLQPAFIEYGFTGMMLTANGQPRIGFCNYECTECTKGMSDRRL